MRNAAFATLLLLGACAHAPSAVTPSQPERTRLDAREVESPRAVETTIATKASDPVVDDGFSASIDLAAFELPVQYNDQVQHYIDLFTTRRRPTFTTWLGRMGRYRGMIEEQLRAAGLPRELVYLPLIESAYENNASSRASAVGLWQFMAGTARAEGLEVSEYIDERRDPIRSTDAAIRHLSGLYNHFRSWYLAAAAYNSGSTRIGRLLKERNYEKGQDEAFWALQDELPRETRDYVPMLLAATIVGENLEHFGLTIESEAPEQFDVVTVSGATELRAVARAAGATFDQIKALNPHLVKGITPPDQRTEVRIPTGTMDGFAERFAKIPQSERIRALTSTHVVKSGETLSGIARRYNTTVEAIKKVNRIKKPNSLAAGRRLIIPQGA